MTGYECRRGHVFTSEHEGPFTLTFGAGIAGTVKIPLAPLCPYCLAEHLNENFAARAVPLVPRAPAPTPPRRGTFVVFEGADACGKTTQVGLLRAKFEQAGRPANKTSFPRYETDVGRAISRYLREGVQVVEDDGTLDLLHVAPEAPLFFQALHTFDRYAEAPFIMLALDAGKSAVSSRWWQSAILYGEDSGLARDTLDRVHSFLPRADLNVLLTLSEEESLRRRPDLRDFLERDRPKQRRLRAAYVAMWAQEAAREPGRWLHVEGDGLSDTEVCELVWSAVRALEDTIDR